MQATIYTTATCPYCRRAKALLTREGIEFEEICLEFDTAEMDELIARTNHETLPQIFFDEEFIGGCDDLEELLASGGLARFSRK